MWTFPLLPVAMIGLPFLSLLIEHNDSINMLGCAYGTVNKFLSDVVNHSWNHHKGSVVVDIYGRNWFIHHHIYKK